jgi:hypothetical protein
MSDEQRQLLKASGVAALLGAALGAVIFGIVYWMGTLTDVPRSGLSRGPGRLIMLCAGLTGLIIPKLTERITGVCGPIMAVPVVAGGLAMSLVLALACSGFYASVAGTIVAGTLAYIVVAGISIAYESAR